MKRYEIFVVGYDGHLQVIADYFSTFINSSTTQGYYAFYKDKELIACYPIDRTIIKSIISV